MSFLRRRRVAVLAGVLLALPALADNLAVDLQPQFTLLQEVGGLGEATDFAFLPDGRMVIVERSGQVRVRPAAGGAAELVGTFAVSNIGEQGLLSVAVHPGFAANGVLYFFLSAASTPEATRNRVVAATLTGGALDVAGAVTVVPDLPAADVNNGGGLAVGPDGLLYVGVGDAGCLCACDPGGSPTAGAGFNYRATCLSGPSGKLLRVGLDGAVPSDNPLAQETAVTACQADCRASVSAAVTAPPRTDIWAWGLRNPRRLSFDPVTGALWVADTGERTYEEVNLIAQGRHHGWPYREGRAGLSPSVCATVTPSAGECVDPVYVCRHDGVSGTEDPGCGSLVGGALQTTCHWPALRDHYLFADQPSATLYALALGPGRVPRATEPRRPVATLSSGTPRAIRVGPDGAVYLLASQGSSGRILRMAPISPVPCGEPDAGADGGSPSDGGATTPDAGSGSGVGAGPRESVGQPPSAWRNCACAGPGGEGASGLPLVLLGFLGLSVVARRRRSCSLEVRAARGAPRRRIGAK